MTDRREAMGHFSTVAVSATVMVWIYIYQKDTNKKES